LYYKVIHSIAWCGRVSLEHLSLHFRLCFIAESTREELEGMQRYGQRPNI